MHDQWHNWHNWAASSPGPRSSKWAGALVRCSTIDLLDANEITWTFATLAHLGCDRELQVTALEQLGT